MKVDFEPLFPENISDEMASVLSTFLHDLASACESRYFTQLRRHHEAQRTLFDPEHPWRSSPSDP